MQTRPSVALLAVFLGACAPLLSPPPAPDVERGVEAFLVDYLAAIGARDAARIRDAYVADGRFIWMEDGEPRYRSAVEVLAALENFPPGSALRTELKDLTVVPVGHGAAHAWAGFRTTIGEGPTAFSFGGTMSFTLERQGTSWKVVAGHSSTPRRR